MITLEAGPATTRAERSEDLILLTVKSITGAGTFRLDTELEETEAAMLAVSLLRALGREPAILQQLVETLQEG